MKTAIAYQTISALTTLVWIRVKGCVALTQSVWLKITLRALASLISMDFVECEPTVDAECAENTQCPVDKVCVNRRCLDPCQDQDVCGLNAECRVKNHRIICACLRMFILTPDQGCKPMFIPECLTNSNCPKDLSCRQQKCVDPCKEVVCGNNTICSVKNHFPVCACKVGYEGDALHSCVPLAIPECLTNSNCPKDQYCQQQKCADPCKEVVCANNTICSVRNHFPVCACKVGYEGDALHSCVPSAIPECLTNSDCPKDQYCRQQKCVDPCQEDVCGNNTICSVKNHFPICACKVGYEGDALDNCVGLPLAIPECLTNSNCPKHQYCRQQKCLDPCKEVVCGNNTICSVKNHFPVCACKVGYEGDALHSCVPSGSAKEQAKSHEKSYFMNDSKVSWYDAFDYCASNNMSLATVNDEKEWNNLLRVWLSKTPGITRLWLGGHDLRRSKKFVWLPTGKPFHYSNWSNGEPFGEELYCIAVFENLKWGATYCSRKYMFACEIR